MKRLADARLYLLATTSLCRRPLAETVRMALAGGVEVVQLREKGLSDNEFLSRAEEIGEIADAAGALFLLNDRVAMAALVRCDGVHVGQDDLPLAAARALLPAGAILGLSTHDLDQARAAERGGADYVGIGPVYATDTKDTGYEPLGAARAGEMSRAFGRPAFAIGGVTVERVPELLAAGVERVAVSSAICGAADPEAAARAFRRALAGGTSRRR